VIDVITATDITPDEQHEAESPQDNYNYAIPGGIEQNAGGVQRRPVALRLQVSKDGAGHHRLIMSACIANAHHQRL
jgi:hypothetical protein